MDACQDDAFFLMFAHGYEFDFGTKESNWDKFKRICEAVAAQDDVIACSIGEAFRQHQIDHGNMDRMAAFRRNKRTL